MSELDKFVTEIEVKEKDAEMYFSVYYIPECYQPEESPYDY